MSQDKEFQKYIASLEEPSVSRENSKYYEDIQKLSYELVKYLRMNEDKNEHDNQGNWNLTYLVENMKPKDFKFVTTRLMRRIPLNELKEMIEAEFTGSSVAYLNRATPKNNGAERIEKSEVDRYLKKKIYIHVGFGMLMGLLLGLGSFWFLA